MQRLDLLRLAAERMAAHLGREAPDADCLAVADQLHQATLALIVQGAVQPTDCLQRLARGFPVLAPGLAETAVLDGAALLVTVLTQVARLGPVAAWLDQGFPADWLRERGVADWQIPPALRGPQITICVDADGGIDAVRVAPSWGDLPQVRIASVHGTVLLPLTREDPWVAACA